MKKVENSNSLMLVEGGTDNTFPIFAQITSIYEVRYVNFESESDSI